MSIECGECERDLRGGHAPSCSRYIRPAVVAHIEALEAERDRLREIIREAHDAMKDGSDATAWAFLHAAVKAETEARAALKGEGE